MKKFARIFVSILTILLLLVGCRYTNFKNISVISRENGSGTRTAFVELFDIQQKSNGTKKDLITKEAIITNKTGVMLINIANDENSIGYVSIGSLNSYVKPVSINNIAPTEENIKNGTYKISRPFNIVVKDEISNLAKDFISFILSKEGQEVVAQSYVAIDSNLPAYSGNKPSGKIVVAGSSSVTPIMEKLKEEYLKINTEAVIEIQMTDSSSGITAAINETCDIAMVSRELRESEKDKLTEIKIAIDGIAVIVNNKNSISNLTKDQVNLIFTGNIIKWEDIIE